MQMTKRPFLMSVRLHTIQPISLFSFILMVATVLRRCVTFFAAAVSVVGAVAGAVTVAVTVFSLIGIGRIVQDPESDVSWSFFTSLDRGIFFGFTSLSIAAHDFRFIPNASMSDGSKTTFAFRMRPLRPIDVCPGASCDSRLWSSDSSESIRCFREPGDVSMLKRMSNENRKIIT